MELNIEDLGNVKLVKLSGKLDINLSLSVETELEDLLSLGSNNLILEISKVSYLSSSGIRVFISTMRKVKEKDGRLVLACIPSLIRNILKTVELEDLFEVYDSVEEAVESFS